jgi:hypothetical protein
VQCIALVAQTVYDHRQVLDADIEDFFGQVVHRKLLGMLKEKIVDPRVLRLIHRILRSGFCEWGKPWQATAQGTPQGGPVSPMLANIYLHYALDVKLWPVLQQSRGRIHLYRFADDFVVVGRERGEMQFIRNLIAGWLAEAGLNLHPKKTRLVDMRNSWRGYDSHFDFLGYRIHLRAYRDNPKRFWIARQPSLKARKALHDNLRNRLVANASLTDASQICQQVWRGWAGMPQRLACVLALPETKVPEAAAPGALARVARSSATGEEANPATPVYPGSTPAEAQAATMGLTLEEPYTGNPYVRFGEGRGREASPTL